MSVPATAAIAAILFMPALSADRSLRFTSTPLNDYGLGLAMTKISPTSSGVQHGMQAEGDQSETSMHPASEQHEPAAPGQDHPLSLLKKRRNRSGESSVRELSLNIERSPAKLTVPRSLSRSRSSGSSTPTTPGSDSIQKSSPYSNLPVLASLLDPPTPGSLALAPYPSSASGILRNERMRTRDMRYRQQDVVLSPRTIRHLATNSPRPELMKRLSLLKPGVLEIENGFLPVRLEGTHNSDAQSLKDMQPIGRGASGRAYAVRLAEDFWRSEENCGRDFVFKAMLNPDPKDPIPINLYEKRFQQHASDPRDPVSLHKAHIYREYQMTVSLDTRSPVMRAYGLVQIDNVFGMLLEKINGITVSNLIKLMRPALQQGTITAPEYLDMARQLITDVLIALSCCEDMGIVHQDVSHNNVIYDVSKKMFRLIDMGLGGEEGEPTRYGTPGFIEADPQASHKRDVYSAAQLLAHFIKRPNYDMGYMGISRAKSEEEFPFMDALRQLPSERKEEIVLFFNRMINRDANGPATAEDLLLDPFIKDAAMQSRDSVHATFEKVT
ncbi:XopAU family type III secretion system effector serine/threonine kinase [Xanthomonas hortorum pv. vitians]|uniref:XopAU family type III secretion system effector serine/threonine kinase n=2 Tax=Xanthomonas hortorum pv. vitians TaxID=83224 RepID=A0AAW8ZV84_9XANT|nr:XopAU family type III secretion system effector serine/threonine kinase [Xanthomonas hortorum]MCC8496583.1 serine/threonine protein kinase [Xanthomonas hortorum pv. gardneri]MCE4282611.1 serine/threonine protein kinase [Xanthomonas hortorum pv. vitians]MCE4285131.1 serine/threonine protein kinase [Xanthomonas hortorum pv. vitians]MCE4290330.1 serine/threonine protein kinase [Xanthomonas hortorum pv. vitians]MCE4293759.1 serine/threonine protein kinase [Xanthomonas hortorum pv. vitians]